MTTELAALARELLAFAPWMPMLVLVGFVLGLALMWFALDRWLNSVGR